jgi:hypothetical protein
MRRFEAAHNRSLDRVNTIAPACDAAQPQAARSRPDTDARPIELAMWSVSSPERPLPLNRGVCVGDLADTPTAWSAPR